PGGDVERAVSRAVLERDGSAGAHGPALGARSAGALSGAEGVGGPRATGQPKSAAPGDHPQRVRGAVFGARRPPRPVATADERPPGAARAVLRDRLPLG